MSKTYLTLSALMAGIVAVHVFMGGPQYAVPFMQELSTPDLRAMSQVLWHAVTVALILVALAYLWLGFQNNRALFVFTSVLQLGWAMLFLYYGVTEMGELATQPQWVLFLGFPAGACWAEGRRNSSQL